MRERGRPRAFDRAQALERAMRLFWARGYEGTSIDALTEAMGINKPSLYAAFGSKEELFREAIALYDATESAPIKRKLEQARTARAAVEAALRHNARAYTRRDRPRGCMVVLASLLGTEENEQVRQVLADSRKAGEQALRRRIERGIAAGDVPRRADPRQMAAFYNVVTQGLAIQARDGTSAKALDAIVDAAMTAWDGLTGTGKSR